MRRSSHQEVVTPVDRSMRNLPKNVRVFFQSLEQKRWRGAEATINRLQPWETDRGDEWMKGYTNALQGLVIALKDRHVSPKPLVLKIGKRSPKNLKALKKIFHTQSRRGLNADFDRGFFRAWSEYTEFLLDKSLQDNKT